MISCLYPIYGLVVSNVENKADNKFLELQLNLIDGLFFTTLEVGSTKNRINVLIDTGSSDFWFPSIKCTDSLDTYISQNKLIMNKLTDGSVSSDSNCSLNEVINFENSATFHRNNTYFNISYLDGSFATGEWIQDEISVNNDSIGIYNFGIANESTNLYGTFGIGLPDLESTNFITNNYSYSNFPVKLKENNLTLSNSYSIYSGKGLNGSLLFGAIDHNKYVGTMYKFPIVNSYLASGYSSLKSIAITLNAISLIQNESLVEIINGYFAVIIDSGTQTAVLPYSLVKSIKQLLKLDCNENTGICAIQCDNILEDLVRFTFQGIDFDIPLSNFFLEIENSGICGLAVKSTYINEYLILGQSFLNNVYLSVNLDDKLVALGNANLETNHNNEKNIEIITSDIPNAIDPPSNETYGLSHMLYSTISYSTVKITNSINYDTIYVKSIRKVGSGDTTATISEPNSFSTQNVISKISTKEHFTIKNDTFTTNRNSSKYEPYISTSSVSSIFLSTSNLKNGASNRRYSYLSSNTISSLLLIITVFFLM